MSEFKPEVIAENVDLVVGGRVSWGRNVVLGANCRSVSIGYGCTIGNDIYIDVEEFRIGDYTTIHHGTVIHGKTCSIGHNCWVGQYAMLDGLGGLLGHDFVGRRLEMAELNACLDDAMAGRGRLVMLAGEPGIGKTRIAEELVALAEQRGAQVLWGWCHNAEAHLLIGPGYRPSANTRSPRKQANSARTWGRAQRA